MSKSKQNIQSIVQFGLLLGIILLINILANARFGNTALYGSLDLTEEKRFTLTDGTKELLRDLDEVVTIEVMLAGKDLPANYKRLRESIQQTLSDFRSISGYVEYRFVDPMAGDSEQDLRVQQELAKQGIYPVQNRVQQADEVSLKIIYPYARFYYKGREAAVNLLYNQVPGMPQEAVLENSIGLLEYQLANMIQKLQTPGRRNVVFTTGHGELTPLETADLEQSLRAFYNTDRLNLNEVVQIDPEIAAIIVAKPQFAFSERDKFKIDQYVMNGGKVLWLIDALRANLDSLRGTEDYIATDYQLNLDNLLFNYGIRIQPNLVLDLQHTRIPLNTGRLGNANQTELFGYPYHLAVIPTSNHPIVKGLNPLNLKFASSIDTTSRTKTDLERTVLLSSSPRTRMQYNPIRLNFDFLQRELPREQFNKGEQPLAIAIEGTFPSLYENRVTETMLAGLDEMGMTFKTSSVPNRMVVVADGDIARSQVNYEEGTFMPLGFNDFEKYQFSNKYFLINAIEYLLDTQGLLEARGKEVKLRLLDETRALQEKSYWQLLNIGLPLVFLFLVGWAYNFVRKRRFGRQ
ncbi:MAG TPA: gliding motility-associated ABC transporter substrate-binding protein GldG [Saprospiraceae bacterium]|nr:gliding motility-associated ABC transporter substrate-binding protein GldG [Saprospiraceae bacterium]